MRSIGFVLVLAGALLAYLGYRGRVGLAWEALRSGSVPTGLLGNLQVSGDGGGADAPAGGGIAV